MAGPTVANTVWQKKQDGGYQKQLICKDLDSVMQLA
jgi:hypothetical protein